MSKKQKIVIEINDREINHAIREFDYYKESLKRDPEHLDDLLEELKSLITGESRDGFSEWHGDLYQHCYEMFDLGDDIDNKNVDEFLKRLYAKLLKDKADGIL